MLNAGVCNAWRMSCFGAFAEVFLDFLERIKPRGVICMPYW